MVVLCHSRIFHCDFFLNRSDIFWYKKSFGCCSEFLFLYTFCIGHINMMTFMAINDLTKFQ